MNLLERKKQFYADRSDRPKAPRLIPDGVPDELKVRPQWILCNFTWKEANGKPGMWSKPPYRVFRDGLASTTDPMTWNTFGNARNAVLDDRRGDGVGFVLSKNDPYAGVDLDGCRDPETGEIVGWAQEIIGRFATYTEISPSLTGVKMFCRGELPAECWHRKLYKGGEIELYDSARYFWVTGHRLESTPKEIHDCQAEIDWMLRLVSEPPTPPPSTNSADNRRATDNEFFRVASNARNGAKFRSLWDGDTNRYCNDQSRADLALVSIIAFYTGPNAYEIDRRFRMSGLFRPKWDEKRGEKTYGERTIDKALEHQTDFFDWTSKPKTKQVKRKRPTDSPKVATTPDEPKTVTQIIHDYLIETYKPTHRRGNAIVSESNEEIPMSRACAVPTTELIEKLATASDAPRYQGGAVKTGSLVSVFKTWSKVAWGDLLSELPDEDTAILDAEGPAADEFRRLVKEAMFTEVVLGDVIGQGNITMTERRSLISWCHRFAKKPGGRWQDIRSKLCWCRLEEDDKGEYKLAVAIRFELMGQLKADKRLREMGYWRFARRCQRYGVGHTSEKDRPGGKNCIILNREFIDDMIAGLDSEVAEGGSYARTHDV